MKATCVWVFVALVCARAAFAQSPETPSRDQAGMSGGSTKIPVTMSDRTEVLGAEKEAASANATPISLEEPVDPNKYICGPGDSFELNFWGQQNFRLRIGADVEGRVFISKVGFVTVAGKTLTDVRADIKKKVRVNYPGLQFDLTLLTPRTFVVHVVNNVKQPGSYVANPLERVSTVLEKAGNANGSRRSITVKRRDGKTLVADLQMYELTGDTAHNPYVLDGDVITVPFAKVKASITGAVHRPGTYELSKEKNLQELVDLAGGFTSSVAKSLPVRITRKGPDSRAAFHNVPFADAGFSSRPILDEDIVEIPHASELQRSVTLLGAVAATDATDAASSVKRLPFVEGDTVRSLIERAGGIRAAGDLSRSYISRPQQGKQPLLIPIDLDALLIRRDFTADKPIQMNDMLVVPPMQYSIRVEGAVTRPGPYPFNPKFGILEYIAHAGGRTRVARDIEDVRLVDPDGRTHAFRSDRQLQPGDAILVPERNFTRAEMVQIGIAVAGLVLSGVAVTLAATR
jgi:polysaccharide biosynthesis/export protein